MDRPIDDSLDEDARYERSLSWIHPEGLTCPGCHHHDRLPIHRRDRQPVPDDRCGRCGRAFNAFTGTALQGTHDRPSTLVLILRGIARGVPTARPARESNCDRGHLLALRHRLQDLAFRFRHRLPLDDPVVEADEPYQDAGEEGGPHLDPEDPPRRRANRVPGHGSRDNDRPPVRGVVGRGSGQIRLRVERHADGPTSREGVRRATWPMTTVHTDEGSGYSGLPALGRRPVTVGHAAGEWARDDDGDGIREVHNDTSGGIRAGLRNFVRPFRGVNEAYLYRYSAIFEWGLNIERVTGEFMRAPPGLGGAGGGGSPRACPS